MELVLINVDNKAFAALHLSPFIHEGLGNWKIAIKKAETTTITTNANTFAQLYILGIARHNILVQNYYRKSVSSNKYLQILKM